MKDWLRTALLGSFRKSASMLFRHWSSLALACLLPLAATGHVLIPRDRELDGAKGRHLAKVRRTLFLAPLAPLTSRDDSWPETTFRDACWDDFVTPYTQPQPVLLPQL